MSTNTLPLPALIESRRIHALAQSGDPYDHAEAVTALMKIAEKQIRSVITEMVSKNGSWIDRAELESVMLELALRQAERYLAGHTPAASFETYIFHGLRKRAIEAIQKEAKHWGNRVATTDLETGASLIEHIPCLEPRAEDRCANAAEITSVFDRAGLEPRSREILTRRFGLGETQREVAGELGILLTTVNQNERRALARVRAVTA